ncbi:hypothetical protein O181_007791 [Austropuccinia psidii MF-1]|uniref:Uncharacterized protein n=1 Tax=Austropuccinia psidii MF-1 TaxID=1389203 RepID=A0A9Q3BLH9_9BASI|nr:hypothetical protein [Austropuccinia psidii MF-1]
MTDTPTPTFLLTIPLLQHGRSKGILNDPFISETRKANDTNKMLDKGYDPHCLQMAIAQAINTITPETKLKVDGSNFSNWEDGMAMLLNDFFDNPEYLKTTTGRTTYGKNYAVSF